MAPPLLWSGAFILALLNKTAILGSIRINGIEGLETSMASIRLLSSRRGPALLLPTGRGFPRYANPDNDWLESSCYIESSD